MQMFGHAEAVRRRLCLGTSRNYPSDELNKHTTTLSGVSIFSSSSCWPAIARATLYVFLKRIVCLGHACVPDYVSEITSCQAAF